MVYKLFAFLSSLFLFFFFTLPSLEKYISPVGMFVSRIPRSSKGSFSLTNFFFFSLASDGKLTMSALLH